MPSISTTLPEPRQWYDRLDLPAYSIAEAAQWAGVHPNTIRYWYYGRSGRGSGIVLPGKKRRTPLTYLQLAEVAFVSTFRHLGVELYRIRDAQRWLVDSMGVEAPFARLRFQTEGIHILLELGQLHPEFQSDVTKMIVADRAGQFAWSSLLADRFAEFDYERGVAVRWHVAGADSSVIIDARRGFGAPTVRGIKTRAISGRSKAGASDTALQRNFGLTAKEIDDALRFEGLRTAA